MSTEIQDTPEVTPEVTPAIETPEVTPEPVAEPTPVVETPPVVPTPTPEPELVYEYQPTDDLGRPLGAKQVFKAKTQQELLDKIANANKELIKLNRDLKKNLRLGNVEQEEIPETAERFGTGLTFEPKPLTPEEKYELSRDLLDPDKFEEASRKIFEANLGATPEQLRQTLRSMQEEAAGLRAREEAQAFVSSNPEYYVCKDNFETMANWMMKNNLQPTRANFQLAFDKLRAVGLLLEAPIVREEVPVVPTPVPEVEPVEQIPANSQPEPETNSRITVEEPTQQPRKPRVASGLNKNNASDGNVSNGRSTKLSVADIQKMPSDEYKRRMKTDPNFAKEVEAAFERAKSK